MLEHLTEGKTRIDRLSLNNPNIKKTPFEVEHFITDRAISNLEENMSRTHTEEFVNKNGWSDFNRLCLSTSITSPNSLVKIPRADSLLERMKHPSTKWMPKDPTRRSDMVSFLNHRAVVMLLFGDLVNEFDNHDKYHKETPERIVMYASYPDLAHSDISIYLSSAILFPSYFKEPLSPNEFGKENGINLAKEQISTNFETKHMRKYANSNIVAWNLYLRLYHPQTSRDKTQKLIDWSKFSDELKQKSTDNNITFWDGLSHVKLLLADEIQITDEGVKAVNRSSDINKQIELPERRRF